MKRITDDVTFKEGEWKGQKRGSNRASVAGDNKEEVLARTIEIAKNIGNSSVVIHKIEGNKIQSE